MTWTIRTDRDFDRAMRKLDRQVSPVRAGGVGLLTGAYQGLYFVSVVAVGVTVSTVVSLGLAPVLLTGVTSLRTRTAPSPRAAAVVVAALAGLVLVAGSSGAGITGPHPLLGILTALGSGTAFAAATALGEPLARAADPLAIAAVTTTVATLGNSGGWRKRRGHH